MRLLLVEDEDALAEALTAALRVRMFVVDHVGCLDDARAAIAQVAYDILVIDRRLPDGDGLGLLADLRDAPRRPATLILTALDGTDEAVIGLDSGADDYLAKPFEMDELAARLRALLRRTPVGGELTIRVGDLVFDLAHREVRAGGAPLPLPRRELLLLEALFRRAGRVVTRERLDQAVYGFDDEVRDDAIVPHISRLRRRLDACAAGAEILTLRGIGYMLRAQ